MGLSLLTESYFYEFIFCDEFGIADFLAVIASHFYVSASVPFFVIIIIIFGLDRELCVTTSV